MVAKAALPDPLLQMALRALPYGLRVEVAERDGVLGLLVTPTDTIWYRWVQTPEELEAFIAFWAEPAYRAAVQEGIDDAAAGRHRSLEEVAHEWVDRGVLPPTWNDGDALEEASENARPAVQNVNPIQGLLLALIASIEYNECHGAKIVDALLARRTLWDAVYRARALWPSADADELQGEAWRPNVALPLVMLAQPFCKLASVKGTQHVSSDFKALVLKLCY